MIDGCTSTTARSSIVIERRAFDTTAIAEQVISRS